MKCPKCKGDMFNIPEKKVMSCSRCGFIISTEIDERRNRVVEHKYSKENLKQGTKFNIGFI